MLAVTFLGKVAPPALAARGFGLEVPAMFLALGLGLFCRQLDLEPRRLTLFLSMLAALGLVQVFGGDSFSLPSLALMAGLGCTLVPILRGRQVDTAAALEFFCNLTALLAVLGIGQFLLQFAAGAAAAFPIETWLDAVRVRGFNNVVPLYYGAHIYKANGIFLLEPSLFSQLCALGLIAELAGRNRTPRLAVVALALVVSYSGTGLVILAFSLPVLVIVNRRYDLLLKGAALLALLAVFADPLNLDVTLKRATEFGASGSSAAERFINWQELFAERLWTSPRHALLGYGFGSFALAADAYRASEMAHSKIIYEFGVLGGLLYFIFFFYCVVSSRAPVAMRMAVAVMYFMNGAYTPFNFGIAASLLLWPASPGARASQHLERSAA